MQVQTGKYLKEEHWLREFETSVRYFTPELNGTS